MISRYQWSTKFAFFCMVTLIIHSLSFVGPLSDHPPACALNFTSYPELPAGECLGVQENIEHWSSFPSTLCCRNALTALSQALAWRPNITEGSSIFLQEVQWRNCSDSFYRNYSVTVDSCGFDKLHYNSGYKCSNFSLFDLKKEMKLSQDALKLCSHFNDAFHDACSNCTSAIIHARDNILDHSHVVDNDTERALCGVAVVIFAAKTLNDHSLIDDFYRCLPVLDASDSGYFKIKYPVFKALSAILIASIVLLLILLLIKYVSKHKTSEPVPCKEISTFSGLYRFSKAEIENAINWGNERKILGRGSAGHVYKGILPSGQVVAIKHIFKNNTSDSFSREVDGLSRIRHPNLVCLFGCCIENDERYLVYEYCSAGNLAQNLLRKDRVLPWEKRVKILRDSALGLRYLHHYIDGCIVHRDIKLTNILLTENMDPKLSDFGLAKVLGMEESKVFTDVRGTIGYMDPEYMSNAKLTSASDIYSFGIVILQLLSGQKVIELDLDARDQLTRKAKDASMGKRPLTDFEDPRLNGNLNRVDFESLLQVAVLCVAKSSKGRPSIDVVFEEIDKAWKNTVADQRAKEMSSSAATSLSGSMEVIPV